MPLPPLSRPQIGALCLAMLTATGYSWAETRAPAPSQGTNVLVVGSDSRNGLSYRQKVKWHAGGTACHCADAIMVVHISADGRRAGVVSLPRDSYVQFAPHRDGGTLTSHHGKINAALSHGGHNLVRRTVERATGLKIHHYVHTKLAGFVKAVDKLGGATVCPKAPLRDSHSGLNLAPGRHHLGGGKALMYARTRYSAYGDINRVRRQQYLVADITDRKIRRGVLADHAKLRTLIRNVAWNLRPGPSTDVADLVRLGWQVRHLKMSDVEFATVPVSDIGYPAPGWGSSVTWNDSRARKLFAAMGADRPLRPADRRDPGNGADWTGRVTPGSRMHCR